MPQIDRESDCVAKLNRCAPEQVERGVGDRAAGHALEVEMAASGRRGEVVDRRPVAEVDMLQNAESDQGVEGAVDACSVDVRIDAGDSVDDLLSREVTAMGTHHEEYGLARLRHTATASIQPRSYRCQ